MNSTYFIKHMLRPLTEICYPQGRGTHERGVMLHFDSGPIHNTKGVQESLANFGFRSTEHLPYSPDLVPDNFFLFSAMKQAFAGQHPALYLRHRFCVRVVCFLLEFVASTT
jgi:hypothetical protein